MIKVSELRDWLDLVAKDDEFVAIDEGGLTLELVGTAIYLEIGGNPEYDPYEEEKHV